MTNKLNLGFLWHLHQPDYRDPVTGKATLPWVRLHSCMGYNDMINLAYRFPQIGQVLNLTPVLIDQLQAVSGGNSDLYYELSSIPPDSLTSEQRQFIVDNFFQANPGTQIEPFPRYRELHHKRQNTSCNAKLFSDRDIRDIQVWFNLCWVGWSAGKDDLIQNLKEKQNDFSEEDKIELLEFQLSITKSVLEKLSTIERDTVSELTFTPFFHPIAPLLCDTNASLVSRPEMPLPNVRFQHPEDALWHVKRGMEKLEELTGHPPKGMWPAEGSVSHAAMEIFTKAGVKWLVTDEGNVYASDPPIEKRQDVQRPHILDSSSEGVAIFFRERDISDAIGFRCQNMRPQDATHQLVSRFEQAADSMTNPGDFMLTVALDGENPWGYFLDYGEGFLCSLMERLSIHPKLAIKTMSSYLKGCPPKRSIQRLHSGSWINSDFHIWIGDPLKNRAWELLTYTRSIITKHELNGSVPERVWHHLHVAEGSDWFWWYGEPNNSDTEAEFDRLFRGHLQQVCRLLGEEIPAELLAPIT